MQAVMSLEEKTSNLIDLFQQTNCEWVIKKEAGSSQGKIYEPLQPGQQLKMKDKIRNFKIIAPLAKEVLQGLFNKGPNNSISLSNGTSVCQDCINTIITYIAKKESVLSIQTDKTEEIEEILEIYNSIGEDLPFEIQEAFTNEWEKAEYNVSSDVEILFDNMEIEEN